MMITQHIKKIHWVIFWMMKQTGVGTLNPMKETYLLCMLVLNFFCFEIFFPSIFLSTDYAIPKVDQFIERQ